MKLTPHIQNILKNSKKDMEWKKEAEERQAARKESKKAGFVATQLAYYMALNDISQTDLGKMIGVKPQQISKIIKGRENLTLSTIEKIENALGIDLIKVVDQEKKVNVDREYEAAHDLMQMALEQFEEVEKTISEIYSLQTRFDLNVKVIEGIKEFKIQEFESLPVNKSLVTKKDYSSIDQCTPYAVIIEGSPLIVSEPDSTYSKFVLEVE